MAKAKDRKAKARRARAPAAMSSPRMAKARKSQTAVPLSPTARRRVRVASSLMEYIAANIDKGGTVIVPAGRIIAKDAEGNNAAVTAAEIVAFVELWSAPESWPRSRCGPTPMFSESSEVLLRTPRDLQRRQGPHGHLSCQV